MKIKILRFSYRWYWLDTYVMKIQGRIHRRRRQGHAHNSIILVTTYFPSPLRLIVYCLQVQKERNKLNSSVHHESCPDCSWKSLYSDSHVANFQVVVTKTSFQSKTRFLLIVNRLLVEIQKFSFRISMRNTWNSILRSLSRIPFIF